MMNTRQTDELIALSMPGVLGDKEGNMRIPQPSFRDFGHPLSQGRGTRGETNDAQLRVIVRSKTLAGQVMNYLLNLTRGWSVVSGVVFLEKDL
jgi:hypothetical protein